MTGNLIFGDHQWFTWDGTPITDKEAEQIISNAAGIADP